MRICKNHITDYIRETLNANPLKNPQDQYQPLTVLKIHRNEPTYFGELQDLLAGDGELVIEPQLANVADISGTRSRSVDFEMGFNILSGFLQALSIEPAAINKSIRTSRKMAFSFSNVRKKYIRPAQLGKLLSSLKADVKNSWLKPVIQDEKIKLGVITDIVISNNFSLSTFTESEMAADIDVPLLDQAISNLGVGVKIHKTNNNEVVFEGPRDLTFAFGCAELVIDPTDGSFNYAGEFKDIKARDAADPFGGTQIPGEEPELKKMLFEDEEGYQLMV